MTNTGLSDSCLEKKPEVVVDLAMHILLGLEGVLSQYCSLPNELLAQALATDEVTLKVEVDVTVEFHHWVVETPIVCVNILAHLLARPHHCFEMVHEVDFVIGIVLWHFLPSFAQKSRDPPRRDDFV
jgi:hypothetical protein